MVNSASVVSQNKRRTIAMLSIFMSVLAGIGLFSLASSSAASNVRQHRFEYSAQNFIPNIDTGGDYLVEDRMGKMAQVGNTIQAVLLDSNQDGTPSAYGISAEGGDIADLVASPPKERNTNRCFTLRATESAATLELVGSGKKTYQVTVTPLHPNNSGEATQPIINWDYVCARNGKGSQQNESIDYVIKHVSGGPVHLYEVEETTRYRY